MRSIFDKFHALKEDKIRSTSKEVAYTDFAAPPLKLRNIKWCFELLPFLIIFFSEGVACLRVSFPCVSHICTTTHYIELVKIENHQKNKRN